MAQDYAEIKRQAIELKDSLEEINKEATSFIKAREALDTVSEKLSDICGSMAETAENSVKLLDEAQSIAVKDTVSALRESADAIRNSNNELNLDVKSTLTESVSNLNKIGGEIEENINNMIDAANNAIADIQKKMLIMGGVSILCAIVAVIVGIVL